MAWAFSSSGFEKLQKKWIHCKNSSVNSLCPFPTFKNYPTVLHLYYTAAKESNDSDLGSAQSDEHLMPSFSVTSKDVTRHQLGLKLGHLWCKYQCRTLVLSVICPSRINNFVPQQNQCPRERLHETSLMRVSCSPWSAAVIYFNFSLLT